MEVKLFSKIEKKLVAEWLKKTRMKSKIIVVSFAVLKIKEKNFLVY